MNRNLENSSSKKSSSIFAEAATIPLSPKEWPAFVAGSAVASDMPNIVDKIATPIDNLCVTYNYLSTSQSDL